METYRRGKKPKCTAIRRRMEENGLTALELSSMAGCHRNHLNKVLAGKVLPGRNLAKSLGTILGIEPVMLWLGENAVSSISSARGTKFAP